MELKELFLIAKRGLKTLYVFIAIGALLGVIAFLLPDNYEAQGTLFIGRNTDKSTNFFTYEGYYGQQTAFTYTTTVASLLQTTDILKLALEKLQVPVNQTTLRQFNRNLSVKKLAPQLVSVTIRNYNKDSARSYWQALTTVIIETSKDVNTTGDPNLQIVKLSVEPVVKPMYKSLVLFIPVGALIGLIIGLYYLSFRSYFKNDSKK